MRYFNYASYRPKYMLLVLGIQTCLTCSELKVAQTKLSFVSYMIAPSPTLSKLPGPLKLQVISRDNPIARVITTF